MLNPYAEFLKARTLVAELTLEEADEGHTEPCGTALERLSDIAQAVAIGDIAAASRHCRRAKWFADRAERGLVPAEDLTSVVLATLWRVAEAVEQSDDLGDCGQAVPEAAELLAAVDGLGIRGNPAAFN